MASPDHLSGPRPGLISVCMSTRDRAACLPRAIESILAQTYADFEFLIMDDASTDETPTILESYARQDSRVRWQRGDNRNLAASLNELMPLAQGQYFARMDDDDVADPERFRQQMDFLALNPRILACGTGIVRVDEDGDTIDIAVPPLNHVEIVAQLLQGNGTAICHPTLLARLEAIRRVEGYRTEYVNAAEDLDLYLRLAEMGELANLPGALLQFQFDPRREEKSTAESIQRRTGYEKAILKQAHAARGLPPPPETEPFGAFRSTQEQRRSLTNMALMGGNDRTARKHALRLLRQAPANLEYWKLYLRGTSIGRTLNKLLQSRQPKSRP